MWIVRLALRRPYTFVVAAILLLIVGAAAILRTSTDIFPNIDIPVVSILFNYGGLSPEEVSDRIVYNFERSLTTTVNDIEHIESQSLPGRAIVKVFFQPGVQIPIAVAQVTAIAQSSIHSMPPGTNPPFIIQYNASTVPILQLALSGQGLTEQQLGDLGQNFVRVGLITVPGVAIPYPYGGKQRQIQVDLNTQAMQAKGLSPLDVVNAVDTQNLILPAGTAKIGSYEYQVDMNGAPQTIQELNDLPIKQVGNSTIYIHDVANVRDGYPPQTNIVRVDGERSALISVLKSGDVSTLDIIANVKKMLPKIEAGLPSQLKIEPLSDQSIFVKASIDGVLREGAIAACLTGLMILIFLGSWRSTLIIAVSIPLSVLTSIIVLSALGQTINIMTLGGLALAVGILVDDATVAIENINRNLDQGKEIVQSILDGSAADCDAGAGFHSFDLHRLRSDVFPQRRRASISSCLSRKQSSLPCWHRICSRAHSFPPWRAICSGSGPRNSAAKIPRNPAIRSSGCKQGSKKDLTASGKAITGSSRARSGTASFSPLVSWVHAFCHSRFCRWSARIFSPASIAASSRFICAPQRAPVLKRRRRFAIAPKTTFVRRFLHPN